MMLQIPYEVHHPEDVSWGQGKNIFFKTLVKNVMNWRSALGSFGQDREAVCDKTNVELCSYCADNHYLFFEWWSQVD